MNYNAGIAGFYMSLYVEIERAKKDPTYYLRVINPEAKGCPGRIVSRV